MRLALKQMTTIAGLTALEAVRQPITLLLTTTAVAGVALLPLVLSHTLGESEKVVRDSALALQFFFGLVIGAYVSCAAITHEIRRGTVSAILSKPVERPSFFLAKYLGVSAVMLVYGVVMLLAVLLCVRTAREAHVIDWWAAGPLLVALVLAYALGGLVNYFRRRPFASSAFGLLFLGVVIAFGVAALMQDHGHHHAHESLFAWRVVPASVLVTMAVLVLASITVSLATRFDTLPTLSIAGLIFLLGLMSDYLFGRAAETSVTARTLYSILPNWQHFWVIDALAGDGIIPPAYVGQVAQYAAVYLVAVLCTGLFAFQHMEVK